MKYPPLSNKYVHLSQRLATKRPSGPWRWRAFALLAATLFVLLLVTPNSTYAFCEDRTDGSTCHTHQVDQALPFLRPEIREAMREYVLHPDTEFTGLDYASDDHFDSCNFDGAIERINGRYLLDVPDFGGAIPALSPYAVEGYVPPDIFRGIRKWSYVLHATQDFYAHTNWVNMVDAGIISADDLIDTNLGPWAGISSDWNLVRDNIITSQKPVPYSWSFDYPTGDEELPLLTDDNGQSYWLLMSGKEFNPFQSCPSPLEMHHDELNKDNITRPLHDLASEMSIAQTAHEWCRLLHLDRDQYGIAGAAVPMGLLVDMDGSPHPQGTACAELPPGPIEVVVSVNAITALDDHDDEDRGELNYVLTLFTDDFRRSVRSQTPTLFLESGEAAPESWLPDTLSMCVESTDRIVATVQGWEDDDTMGTLEKVDNYLVGTTHEIGTGTDVANGIGTGAFTLSTDNPQFNDMEVVIEVSNSGTDADGDGLTKCDELGMGLDPEINDSDGDGLNDGDEVALGTNPLNADSDGDGLHDGDEVALGTDPLNTDSDGDSLHDGEEIDLGTDPTNADSDGDGLNDGEEINQYGTNPTDADSDDDLLNDGQEVAQNSDPLTADSDGDGLLDGRDVEFIQNALMALPESAYSNIAADRALQNRLEDIEASLLDGRTNDALDALNALRQKMDGCGPIHDANDTIADCNAQLQIRPLVDLLSANWQS